MRKYFISICLFISGFQIVTSGQDNMVWTLSDCIAYALEQNTTVRKTTLNNESLVYLTDLARAQRMPSLNAAVNQSFDWRRSMAGSALAGTTSSGYSLNSGITVFNASRVTHQIKQAELDMENGKYNLETTRESISLNILNAFLQVLYAEELVKNSEKQIESTTQLVSLALERFTLQIISQADYAQVKSQLASERLNLANASSQLAIARVNLMQLMELPVSETFEIARPDLEVSLNQNRDPSVESVYDTALNIKPQIKSAAIGKEIALLDEKIAKAGYFPSLSASAGIGTNAAQNLANDLENKDPYFDQLNNAISPSAGLSLSIPIYQRKQTKTNVALAKIGYQTAELVELDTRNQLRKNIEQACQDVISAQIAYEASVEKYIATQESAALSDEKFIQGIINSVDYLVSKTNLIVAESELLQSKYNLIYTYKILDFFSGIPLTL